MGKSIDIGGYRVHIYTQLFARNNGHFVWIDRPKVILAAIEQIWLSEDKS